MILLIASDTDIASQNIAKQVLSKYAFSRASESFEENPVYEANFGGKGVKFVTLRKESIYAQNLPDFFTDLELVVFISRHSSESGTPTLSVHVPGNLGEAEFGGIPRKVSVSPANAMRDALKTLMKLKQEMRLEYDVSYECTHHGPSLDVPAMFVELGSSIKQWNDPRAAEVVAQAAIEAISKFGDSKVSTVLGIGGTHYNAKFTRMALESGLAFAHMVPKYAIPFVDSDLLKQCVERTLERVECAILDWKGIKGEHKQPLIRMLEEIGLPCEKA